MMVLSVRRANYISGVPHRYVIMWASFNQSSPYESLTYMFRNTTVLCMYGLAPLVENIALKNN